MASRHVYSPVGAEGMVGVALALRPLRREVDRCAYVAMATAMQIAACNNEHPL